MQILQRIKVPTGDILVVEGERGKLEMLSLGDYGKDVNLKCDALGLTRDIKRVEHTELLSLTEKWVITISTQYGCSMGCQFCDVPQVGSGRNVTVKDILDQVATGISLHPEVRYTKRLNLHYARMGEPTWNPAIIEATELIDEALRADSIPLGVRGGLHPVVSTMMPKSNKWLFTFLRAWMAIKNNAVFGNDAGLQLSVNSTNEEERKKMFNNNALTLDEIGTLMHKLPGPAGRKITLNFAVADWEIDPVVLLKYFNPRSYIIKLTPMHKTLAAIQHEIKTEGDYTTIYPYKEHEDRLKDAGYDVLVFVASKEEDESRITCGNAILSGSEAAFGEIIDNE